ncbi:MAG: hypothetical protein Q8J63_01250 [Candidatus Aquicultor sp.]|nr:hypothetical protein [Candidatus Aquicultor sp.]
MKTVKADLNGDSKPESISISDIRPSGDFVLHINDLTVKGDLKSIGVPADGFVVVDIDTSDRYQEVGVHTPGPSDDDAYLFYWYDGSAIHEMKARLGRWPKFPGNGIVYVDSWMGFWKITDKYVLTKKRNLRLVPQQFHYVGETGMVHKSIPLYERPASSNIVANLKVNSPIVVVLADLSGNPEEAQDIWYLIKTETNLLGWTKGHVFPDSISAGTSAD